MDEFRKRRADAPEGFFAVEAEGLRWLGEPAALHGDGVAVVQPIAVTDDELVLPRVPQVAPTVTAARAFGAALAVTHAAGAAGFGCPPGRWTGDGFIGPLDLPHHHAPDPEQHWGRFHARLRLRPFLAAARARGAIDAAGERALDDVCARLEHGDPALTGPPEPPARIHGDLWAGNVLWGPDGVVLVDPAAHGGHRESDLAMLSLFGLPHLDAVLDGYQSVAPLAPGWRRRVAVHQLHPLLVHAVLFGPGYGAQAARVARAATTRTGR